MKKNKNFINKKSFPSLDKLDSLLAVILKLGVIFSLIILVGIIFSQITFFFQNPSFLEIVLVVLLFLFAFGLTVFEKKKQIFFISLLFLILALALRLKSIPFFHLQPQSDLLEAFNYATAWVKGPKSALHAFVFSHWGIYGLFLKNWFSLVGSSVLNAKIINIIFSLFAILGTFYSLYFAKNKRIVALSSIFLICFYPVFAFYINFLSGETIFVGLLSIALLFLTFLDFKKGELFYYGSLLGFLLFLTFANLLKQMTIVTLPLSLILIFYYLIKNKYIKRTIPTMLLFAVVFIIPFFVNKQLEYYAKGPLNTKASYLFLASGLSQRTDGQWDGNYYKPYVEKLTEEYNRGILTKESYNREGDKLKTVVIDEIKNYWALPKLFDKKVSYIWANDNNISYWFFTEDSRDKLSAKYFIDLLSNSFYLVISGLFIVNLVRTLKEFDDSLLNLFSIFFVSMYFIASLFIEGQARYRIILIPSLVVCASSGLLFLRNYALKIKNIIAAL